MEIAGGFSIALGKLIYQILNLFYFILIGRIIISWVNADPRNPIVQTLYKITEPILYPVRKKLPDAGGLDLSPIVVLFAIYFLQELIIQLMN